MKNYQINIIKEYVSTALISDDPEEHLHIILERLLDYLNVEQLENELEFMYQFEKQMPLRK
jgi:hypothetical protein